MAKVGTTTHRWCREYIHENGTRYRTTYARRSDGALIKKAAFYSTGITYEKDHWHDWGWTRSKTRLDTPEQTAAWAAKALAAGYKEVTK